MKALITGIYGQDGYYLSKKLKALGYEVYGITNATISNDCEKDNIEIIDIVNKSKLESYMAQNQFDEIYHFAAQSDVALSYKDPELTYKVNYIGSINLLDLAIKYSPHTKFFFAGSAELFGSPKTNLQSELTPFAPISPYGLTKYAAYLYGKMLRETYSFNFKMGILYNHESILRGSNFVTQKIANGVVKIVKDSNFILEIGNISSKRDWGFAEDYVDAIHLITTLESNDDFIVASGTTHSVKELIEEAFRSLGEEIEFKGEGYNVVGLYRNSPRIVVNKEYYRDAETHTLCGDNSKLKRITGWKPKKNFSEIVNILTQHALEVDSNH